MVRKKLAGVFYTGVFSILQILSKNSQSYNFLYILHFQRLFSLRESLKTMFFNFASFYSNSDYSLLRGCCSQNSRYTKNDEKNAPARINMQTGSSFAVVFMRSVLKYLFVTMLHT